MVSAKMVNKDTTVDLKYRLFKFTITTEMYLPGLISALFLLTDCKIDFYTIISTLVMWGLLKKQMTHKDSRMLSFLHCTLATLSVLKLMFFFYYYSNICRDLICTSAQTSNST